jgi:DNA-binding response OmpR family regulator
MRRAVASKPIVVCDPNPFARRLVGDVLRGAGFEQIRHARNGSELMNATLEYAPQIAITASRIPGVSGLEYVRAVRAGMEQVNRAMPVIVMTTTPTQSFIEAARASGVDEMLVTPFNARALLARIDAVVKRPRLFVDSVCYVGPCRRRRMLEDFIGPHRRLSDPLDGDGRSSWESEESREAVRACVRRLSELTFALAPGDRRKLREIFVVVQDAEGVAEEARDLAMVEAVRSLARYISAIGAARGLDAEVVSTHVDAMQKLSFLGANHHDERCKLVDGLVAVVDKRLRRAA